jgi:hypothetical protein
MGLLHVVPPAFCVVNCLFGEQHLFVVTALTLCKKGKNQASLIHKESVHACRRSHMYQILQAAEWPHVHSTPAIES